MSSIKDTEIAMADLSRTRAHEIIRMRIEQKSAGNRFTNLFKQKKVIKILLRSWK